jgi:RNA polymerase sigma factor (sigma-70 family)
MLLSDDRLTRRAIAGERRALTTIFERYQEPLYRYCLAILGDREDAEDALQGTMVKVLRSLPGEQRRIELKPWIYRIAHNEAVDLIRRRRPSEELDAELLSGGIGPAEEAEQRQRLGWLLADLDQLPERQRGALVMRELGGLEFAEIGTALGTSAAVARQTLYEARLGLREMGAGREMGCEEVMRAISDADGRVLRRRDIRAHLRGCDSCRRFREEIGGRERDLAALSPLPAAIAAGILHGVLGGGAGGGGGAGAAMGAGAAKAVGTSTLLKGAATVAVVAVIGAGAADKGGLVHLGLPGDGSSGSSSKGAAQGSGPMPASKAEDGGGAVPAAAGVRTAKAASAAGVEPARVAARDSADAGATGPVATETTAPSAAAEPGLPSAAAPGQETAATHKATSGNAAGKASHPEHPSHPPKPVRPEAAHPDQPVHPSHPEHPPKPEVAASPGPEPEQGQPEPPGREGRP